MIHPGEQWVDLPILNVYNTQMMMAAVNVAKDMYEKGLQQIKDFKNEYGDFFSPIQKDMDWYSQNVTGKVRDTINALYDAGIDPIKSAEGRAAVSRVINSIDVGLINSKRNAAKAADEYIKSRDALIKANMFNPEYEREMLGGQTLEEWDGRLGNWKATSASPYLDYERKYGHLFENMDYEYDPEESERHPGIRVLTKSKSRMHNILSVNRPDIVNDPQYKYDLGRIRNVLKIANPTASDKDLDDLAIATLENEIVERNYKGGMRFEQDPIYLDNLRTANDIKAHRANADTDYYYYKLQHPDDDPDDNSHNIFRRAEKLADFADKNKVGEHTLYEMSQQYYQQIDPVILAGMITVKDKTTGEAIPAYKFHGTDLSTLGSIAYLGRDGKMYRSNLKDPQPGEDFTFIGDGNIRALKVGTYNDGSPRYKYWISGKLLDKNNATIRYVGDNPNVKDNYYTTWIPVKERDRNYGQTLRKK